jgi:hypothetical protein
MKGPTSGGTGGRDGTGSPGRGLTDAELRAILDGMSQVMEGTLDRLDDQTRALHKLTAAVEALGAKPGPAATIDLGGVSRVTGEAVRDALKPTLTKLVDVLETMTGAKALLRERMRAMDREEARQGRWRFQPWAVVVGIPLAALLALALTVPRAAAQFSPTCRLTGGTWYDATDSYTAACMYPKEGRDAAAGS